MRTQEIGYQDKPVESIRALQPFYVAQLTRPT